MGVCEGVVLVDGSACREFGVLRELLHRGFGVPTVRWDLRGLSTAWAITDSCGAPERPAAVWVRHVPPRPSGPRDSQHDISRAEVSWFDRLKHLQQAAAMNFPGIEPPPAQQLMDADRLGVRTPRTLFTTDIAAAWSELATSPIVVKVPGPRWTEPTTHPTVVTRMDELPAWAGSPPAGLAVQEYVRHVRELRVYFHNGGVCALQVDKPDAASVWTNPAEVSVTPVKCETGLEHVVQLLSAEWGLRFAAFDFLETEGGDFVFLEVNVDGDWLYFERRAGWDGVTFMAAVMLYEQHTLAITRK